MIRQSSNENFSLSSKVRFGNTELQSLNKYFLLLKEICFQSRLIKKNNFNQSLFYFLAQNFIS